MVTVNLNFIKYLKYFILNDVKIGKFYNIIHPHSKYLLDDILIRILYILKTGLCWRSLDHFYFNNKIVKWKSGRSRIYAVRKSVYFHFCRFVNNNIFKKLFMKLRTQYIQNNKIHIQIIDSTFILNKNGKNFIARNKFYKNKNCNKVSIITDVNGTPLSVFVKTGNKHDLSFMNYHKYDLFVRNKNKSNIILLADKGYESKKIRTSINQFNYQMMIPKKSNMKQFYQFDKNLYKKRIIVEHAFQKIKAFRKIANIINYLSFLYLATSILIFNNI